MTHTEVLNGGEGGCEAGHGLLDSSSRCLFEAAGGAIVGSHGSCHSCLLGADGTHHLLDSCTVTTASEKGACESVAFGDEIGVLC